MYLGPRQLPHVAADMCESCPLSFACSTAREDPSSETVLHTVCAGCALPTEYLCVQPFRLGADQPC